MALFESYDRRETQILAVINEVRYQALSKSVQTSARLRVLTSTSSLKAFSLSALKTLSGLTQ